MEKQKIRSLSYQDLLLTLLSTAPGIVGRVLPIYREVRGARDSYCDKLWSRANELIGPNITEVRSVRYFPFGGDTILGIECKTHRTGNDCCGTAWPTEEAMEGARKFSREFDLTFEKWDSCEKGWGDFLFSGIPLFLKEQDEFY